jgi:hypothetical protein
VGVSGTLAVVTLWGGHESVSAGFDADEAQHLAEAVAELGGWDKPPEVRDMLPDLEARFPVGTAVWLGKSVYWRRGQRGVVAAGEPESYARWPERGPSPWFLSADGAEVYVVLDDGYASWWRSTWLETR